MKRTVNPTGKVRIEQDYVSASFLPASIFSEIQVSWNLETFSFHDSADVVVEITTLGNTERRVQPLASFRRGSLTFKVPENSVRHSTTVQLFVSDVTSLRLILGSSARMSLTPSTEKNSKSSLLPVQPLEDLEQAFALDFTSGSPVLQVSNKDGIFRDLVSNPLFLPTILPSVVQTIAYQCLAVSDPFDSNVLDSWDRQFISWGCDADSISRVRSSIVRDQADYEALAQAQELAEFITECFAKKQKFAKRLRDSIEKVNQWNS